VVTRGFHPVTIFVRLMGLARALESTRVVRDGSTVTVRSHLEPEELAGLVERLRSME
jgi:hypothetical protein